MDFDVLLRANALVGVILHRLPLVVNPILGDLQPSKGNIRQINQFAVQNWTKFLSVPNPRHR
jgi:hypothetical protein